MIRLGISCLLGIWEDRWHYASGAGFYFPSGIVGECNSGVGNFLLFPSQVRNTVVSMVWIVLVVRTSLGRAILVRLVYQEASFSYHGSE